VQMSQTNPAKLLGLNLNLSTERSFQPLIPELYDATARYRDCAAGRSIECLFLADPERPATAGLLPEVYLPCR